MEKKHRSSSPKPGLRKGWCIQFSRVTTRPSPCSSSSVSTSGNPSDSIFRSTRSRCPTQAGADNLSWIVFTLKTNSLYWGTCHYGEKVVGKAQARDAIMNWTLAMCTTTSHHRARTDPEQALISKTASPQTCNSVNCTDVFCPLTCLHFFTM